VYPDKLKRQQVARLRRAHRWSKPPDDYLNELVDNLLIMELDVSSVATVSTIPCRLLSCRAIPDSVSGAGHPRIEAWPAADGKRAAPPIWEVRTEWRRPRIVSPVLGGGDAW
jgi:hypothetical protein